MFVSSISYKTCHVTKEYIDLFTLQQHPYEGQIPRMNEFSERSPPLFRMAMYKKSICGCKYMYRMILSKSS